MIELADRDPTGGQHHVKRQCFGQTSAHFFGMVTRDLEHNWVTAGLPNRRREGIGARINHLRSTRNGVDVDQFVARRDDRDAGPPIYVHHRTIERRQHAEVRRTESLPWREDKFSALQVFAARTYERALLGRSQYLDLAFRSPGSLHRYDCVGAVGDWRAGHRAHRLTGFDPLRGHHASPHRFEHFQSDRVRLARSLGIASSDCISIHRRVVEARHRLGRDDVLGGEVAPTEAIHQAAEGAHQAVGARGGRVAEDHGGPAR